MRIEHVETAKTVDLAIENACEKLGCQREDCEWEILDLPKKSLFGLKTTPARVRVAIDRPDAPKKPEPVPQRQETQSAAQTEPRPRREQPKFQPKPRPEAARPQQKPQQPPKTRPEPKPAQSADREDAQPGEGFAGKEAAAKEYLSGILSEFGLQAELASRWEHGGLCINLEGDGLGAIIGRRGETLDALQYLTGLVANRLEGDYLRLNVDCGDYRFKRKDTLEALAKKLAAQVLKTNVSKTLEPMNPFERRIIHATVSEIEGVSSSSIGEEPNRRIVITSPTSKQPSGVSRISGERAERRPPAARSGKPFIRNRPESDNYETEPERTERPARGGRGGDRDRGGDRSGRGGRDRGRGGRSAAPVPSGPPKKTPESEATDGIAFGKVDLE